MTPPPDFRALVIQAVSVLGRSRTYLNLIYLVLSLPLAIVYFVVLLLCAVGGAVLAIVGVGFLILLGGLAAASGFSMLERELAISLLGVDLPPPAPLPSGPAWRRLRAHLARPETWKSIAYLALKLPFGLFVYALGSLILVPALGLLFGLFSAVFPEPGIGRFIRDLIDGGLGFALLVASLHAANFLAGSWSRVAVAILGPSEQQRRLWEAQRRAEAADQKRRELIVNVSHELRTPIASIQGHLDSLLMPSGERPAGIDERHYLEVAAAETQRLSLLVNELLELARADTSQLALEITPIDVGPIARQVIRALEPLARQERQVTLVNADGTMRYLALADGERLTQVLNNLVRNAINHTPPGGAVKVDLRREGDDLLIEVADTGSGIAAEELDRIFDRFYRTDEGRARDAGGFGLGLSISKDLVEAMGGTLTATSELGVGSTFRVRLKQAGP